MSCTISTSCRSYGIFVEQGAVPSCATAVEHRAGPVGSRGGLRVARIEGCGSPATAKVGSKASAFVSGVAARGRVAKQQGRPGSTRVSAAYNRASQPGSVGPSDWSSVWKRDWSFFEAARDQVLRRVGMAPAKEEDVVQQQQEQLLKLEGQLAEANKKIRESEEVAAKALDQLSQLGSYMASTSTATSSSQSTAPDSASQESSTTSTPTHLETSTTIPTPVAAPAASPAAPAKQSAKSQRKPNGLHSSLEISDNLKRFWYPIEFSSQLTSDTLVPMDLFNQPWVLFRDADGKPGMIRDECAHRACPLSLGENVNGCVQCPYHGWEYNGQGECESMPSTVHSGKGVGVRHLECREDDGLIFVWPAEGVEPDLDLPVLTSPSSDFHCHAEITLDVPVEHGLLLENLLDLAHAPFTHTSTFAKGWPVPDIVKFQAREALTGNWDPYPIDMSFLPPACVQSTIGLNKPGDIKRGMLASECSNHLHQLHVCLPSKEGHTRLLYRMSLDFMPWVQYVPGIKLLWKEMANQVLGEDLRLVQGQQDRLVDGGDTWNAPVAYDKLAVRYRRWRNSLDVGDGNVARGRADTVTMTAGEMFEDEEIVEDQEYTASEN